MNYKNFLAGFVCILLTAFSLNAQSPIGTWKTIDDETGEAKSYVEIFEQDGKLHGKLIKLLQVAEDSTCDKCPGDKKDKPLLNMVILWDLEKYKDYWSYGKIMDPNNGKTYKCSAWVEGDDKLKLRGYIGISALGRNQTWHRVK